MTCTTTVTIDTPDATEQTAMLRDDVMRVNCYFESVEMMAKFPPDVKAALDRLQVWAETD